MRLSSVGMEAQETVGSPRSALGTITNSPREVATAARAKTPRGGASTSTRQLAALAAQRPSFPYLRRQQDGNSASIGQAPAADCKFTPKKEQLGSLLASLKVENPQIGVKKLKVKVQEQEPAWKIGCKEVRCGLNSTPVREALRYEKASAEKGMLEASFRTSSVDISLGRDEAVSTSPERAKSEGSLVDCMRASLAVDSRSDQPRPGLSPSFLSLVERMKSCEQQSAAAVQRTPTKCKTEIRVKNLADPSKDTPRTAAKRAEIKAKVAAAKCRTAPAAKTISNSSDVSIQIGPMSGQIETTVPIGDAVKKLPTHRERLVVPPLPPRDNNSPPPLPPRDCVAATVSALKLGLRWKARAMQAAAERQGQAVETAAEAHIELQGTNDPLYEKADVRSADEDEEADVDPAAEQRRRAFLSSTSAVLASPVMHYQHPYERHELNEDDILASPTVEARSRRCRSLPHGAPPHLRHFYCCHPRTFPVPGSARSHTACPLRSCRHARRSAGSRHVTAWCRRSRPLDRWMDGWMDGCKVIVE